jgi:hypothetical protein
LAGSSISHSRRYRGMPAGGLIFTAWASPSGKASDDPEP